VFAASDSVAWVVSSAGAYRTHELGVTWQNVMPPGFSPGGFAPLTIVDADTAYATSFDLRAPATVSFTHDGGRTWSQSNIGAPAFGGTPMLSFRTASAGTASFGGGKDTGPYPLDVFATSDGGASWTHVGNGAIPPLRDGLNKLPDPKGGYLWHSAYETDGQPFNNRFFLSPDGGFTWLQHTFPISDVSPKNASKSIQDIVPLPGGQVRIAIASGASDGNLAIYDSTDDPAAWQLVYQAPDTGFDIQLVSPNVWKLVSTTEIRSTVDAGAHWISVTPDPDPGFWHVHFATANTGWARVGPTGDPNTLIVTTDGGATWRRVGS
jgi:hypothetical protein